MNVTRNMVSDARNFYSSIWNISIFFLVKNALCIYNKDKDYKVIVCFTRIIQGLFPNQSKNVLAGGL